MRILAVLLLAAVATADEYPPGDYSEIGVVVRRARGDYDLFTGYACMLTLDTPLALQLKPYLGKRIRIDFTRVELEEGMLWDPSGAPIGRIRKITVLPDPPVKITVKPAKPFAQADPVVIEVTVANRGEHALRDIECNLLHDYRSKLEIRSRELVAPGKTATLKLTANRMAKPGRYDAIVYGTANDIPVISAAVPVEVRKPEDEAATLRAWLPRAEPEQRIAIAERLMKLGDRTGVDAVVALLPDKYVRAYSFVWEHGGEAGERLLLDYLRREKQQDLALRIIEEVHRSPRAIALLQTLLNDRRETFRSISGWCDRPRVCDITARWLTGYTDGKMKFPVAGSLTARDAAVAAVIEQLQKNPARFSVLAAD